MNPKVDTFISNAKKWQLELTESRRIVLECRLTEDFKWRQPCYTFQNSIVLILSGFKDYFAISFFKGALLKDSENILIQPTENMQAVRHIRFANVQEIVESESILKDYIRKAIEIEKAGLKVEYKKTSEFKIPSELQEKFDSDPKFKTAFEALTQGRQRGYLLHFSSAKQSSTRTARIEKFETKIYAGKGFNER